MNKSQSISLSSAIFMNLNIIAGAGLFVNTVMLTKLTGTLSCLSYLLVGIFILPLVYSFAELLKFHPAGGFYNFSKSLSPLLGFISGWTYFFSKLASASLVIYVSSVFLQQCFSILQGIPTILISVSILATFTYLNLFNVSIGSTIQKLFLIAKSIPILSIIGIGIWYTQKSFTITADSTNLANIPTCIPFILYSLVGFEAACSMSRKIQNPTVNGPKAIFYSFFTILGIYATFQLMLSNMIFANINNLTSYKEIFPYIASLLPISSTHQIFFANLISGLIGFAALGGAYGMLFSNLWNFYILAEHEHTFLPKVMTKLNSDQMPTWTIVIEGCICLFFMLITQGNQVPLQQISAFGGSIAYTLSILGLLQIKPSPIAYLGLMSCLILLTACIISFLNFNILTLILFSIMLSAGIVMFLCTKKRRA